MISAIIVAAGSGVRMQAAMRKQYIPVSGIPILGHTLLVFDACERIDSIILVVPKDDFAYCSATVISPLDIQKDVKLVEGGKQRSDSVYNGLLAVHADTDIVVIHDGVRPVIRPDQICACIDGARTSGACILGIPVYDTVKYVNPSGGIEKTLNRDDLWLAQTPQAFQYHLILNAHKEARKDGFSGSDDAQLIERQGNQVQVIQGSRWNIKLTEKEDLCLAHALLKERLVK